MHAFYILAVTSVLAVGALPSHQGLLPRALARSCIPPATPLCVGYIIITKYSYKNRIF